MAIIQRTHSSNIHYGLIYILSILFAFHTSLVLFINSSYIETFVSSEAVGALFMIGSSLAVFAFLFIARALRKVGNVRLTLWLAVTEVVALVLLGLALSPALTITAFVLFLVVNPLIFLNLDIFSETIIGDAEDTTGYKRGLVLALVSLAAMLGPLAIGPLAGPDDANLAYVYFASAAVFSVFIIMILIRFKHFTDPAYSEVRPLDALACFWRDHNIRLPLFSQFLLQLCFSWLVIYVPLYLSSVIGLTWSEIGLVIAVGTLAYVLFEFPVGYMADNYWGEKEMMIAGFAIIAASVASISLISTEMIVVWMIIMFIIRIGASLIEVTTESYFFKHTKGDDTNFMSFFRLSRPLAIVAGGLLGSLSLLYLPFSAIFFVLGAVMCLGIVVGAHLQDTK